MPQIRPSLVIISLALTVVLGGCGDKRSQDSSINPDTGNHVANWVKLHPAEAFKAMDLCSSCHGSDFTGGISGVSCMSPAARSGFRCHASNPADNPSGCASCHGGQPAGPFGATAPNRKSAHAKHTALTGVPVVCDTCHLNAGYGAANHAKASASGGNNIAEVSISGYDAATKKCSNISCHGYKVTPAWDESITMVVGDNEVCFNCHNRPPDLNKPQTPQYNDWYSGIYTGTTPNTNLHISHLVLHTSPKAFCTDCHNISKLNDRRIHFGGLATRTFTAPGETVGFASTRIGSYDTATQTCSNVACHTFNARWNQ